MAEKRRGIFRWLMVRLLIFAAGVAVGYVVRDKQADRLRSAYDQALVEIEQLKQESQAVLERGRRAGESLRSGAEAAVDSTKAAVEEIKGESKN